MNRQIVLKSFSSSGFNVVVRRTRAFGLACFDIVVRPIRLDGRLAGVVPDVHPRRTSKDLPEPVAASVSSPGDGPRAAKRLAARR